VEASQNDWPTHGHGTADLDMENLRTERTVVADHLNLGDFQKFVEVFLFVTKSGRIAKEHHWI